jgi:hypothetical protein
MLSVRTPLPVALGVAGVLVLFCVLNVRLQKRVTSLEKQLKLFHGDIVAENTPLDGTRLPMLKGQGPDGVWTLNLAQFTSRRVILLFDVECKACEDNWFSWNELLGNPKIAKLIVPVATSGVISKAYLDSHHLSGQNTLIGLDTDLQFSSKLHATPQTILENGGIVEKSWPGILSTSDVREITAALASKNETLTHN